MITRDIFQKLELEVQNPLITVLTGARQVGKTTALKHVYELHKSKSVYLTFDDPFVKHLFESNIELFVQQYVVPYDIIFIDEFQYVKTGGKSLKYIYDVYKKKFFISGSSIPEIAIQSLQYVVGRVSLLQMYPLTFTEFVQYKSPHKKIVLEKGTSHTDFIQLQGEFEEFLMFGGYPAVVLEPDFMKKKKLLADIVSVYVLKEIKDVLGYTDSFAFEKLLIALATQNGKMHKISSLTTQLSLSWHVLSEYISVLEKTTILTVVRPFHTNKLKEITKMPKLYLHDFGFLNALLRNFSPILSRTDKGELLELFILLELRKKDYVVQYWSRQESEVDFVYAVDAKLYAFECKSTFSHSVSRSFMSFLDLYTVAKGYYFVENATNSVLCGKTPVEVNHYLRICNLLL
jgi:uncharacterized protein